MKNLKKGVISELLGRNDKANAMKQFILASEFDGGAQPYLHALEEQYNSIQSELERCALLEEIILLHQFLANQPEPKFSLVERYIYARASVYRRDVAIDDLRVIVVSTSTGTYEDLIQDPVVIQRAKNLIAKKVNYILQEKLTSYHAEYGALNLQVA